MKENQGDAGQKLELLQRKYRNLEDQHAKEKEGWLGKERDFKDTIKSLEQLKRDLQAEVQKLEKNLADANKNSKGDNQQIEAMRKELYVLTTAKDQLSKELESALANAKGWPAQLDQITKELKRAVEEKEQALQDCEEAKRSSDVYMDRLSAAEKDLKKERIRADKFEEIQAALQVVYDKMKTTFEPISSTLSCLSCLEYLKEPNPLTLVCGHSICKKCFSQHSDPNSKDSLVFCEECKIETKNKQLRDSKVMQLLCSKFHGQRNCLESMEKIFAKA